MKRLKRAVQRSLSPLGLALVQRKHLVPGRQLYQQDGLVSWHNQDFMQDPEFCRAYARGLQAADGIDPQHHWRVHIALWVAARALSKKGDFVECGVNAGFMSSAIMAALDWNARSRDFWLIDTFEGPPPDQLEPSEIESGLAEKLADAASREAYVTDLERIRSNFAEWPGARLLLGAVPKVLEAFPSVPVAFLHLDMNAAQPERSALEYFWPRLSDGAFVLLDDYAFLGCKPQKSAIDTLGTKLAFEVLSLPTGQGLIIR